MWDVLQKACRGDHVRFRCLSLEIAECRDSVPGFVLGFFGLVWFLNLFYFYTPLHIVFPCLYREFSSVEIQFIPRMRKGRASFFLISLRNAVNCQLEDR